MLHKYLPYSGTTGHPTILGLLAPGLIILLFNIATYVHVFKVSFHSNTCVITSCIDQTGVDCGGTNGQLDKLPITNYYQLEV